MTKREEILTAVLTKLKTVGTVTADKVVRSRVDPFNSKKLPAVSIEPVSDIPDAENTAYIDRRLIIKISVFVQGEVPDQTADPIIESIQSKMMEDRSLGGLLMDMSPRSIDYEFLELEKPTVGVYLDFQLDYRTLPNEV